MNRRFVLAGLPASLFLAACSGDYVSANADDLDALPDVENWRALTEADWQARLTQEQYRVLRRDGTERAFTSPLNNEKRRGMYHCAGCDLALFSSAAKYDSGTGWPSFWEPLPGRLGTKPDNILFYPRTEYHCIRCKGHQGHVFDDGPRPTGQRWCNNGVALTFYPDKL